MRAVVSLSSSISANLYSLFDARSVVTSSLKASADIVLRSTSLLDDLFSVALGSPSCSTVLTLSVGLDVALRLSVAFSLDGGVMGAKDRAGYNPLRPEPMLPAAELDLVSAPPLVLSL